MSPPAKNKVQQGLIGGPEASFLDVQLLVVLPPDGEVAVQDADDKLEKEADALMERVNRLLATSFLQNGSNKFYTIRFF